MRSERTERKGENESYEARVGAGRGKWRSGEVKEKRKKDSTIL